MALYPLEAHHHLQDPSSAPDRNRLKPPSTVGWATSVGAQAGRLRGYRGPNASPSSWPLVHKLKRPTSSSSSPDNLLLFSDPHIQVDELGSTSSGHAIRVGLLMVAATQPNSG